MPHANPVVLRNYMRVYRQRKRAEARTIRGGRFTTKLCTICGNKYRPTSGRQKFCNQKCWVENRKQVGNHTTAEQYNRVNKDPRQFFVKLIHGRGRGAAGCRSALTPEFLMEMYNKQNGRCAVSGLPLSTKLVLGGDWYRCSIDRIDNEVGYIPENAHLVCKGVNIARNAQSLDEFIDMCKAVVKYQENKNGT